MAHALTGAADAPAEVRLRDVQPADVAVFFAHQDDAEASRMAAFPRRGRLEHLAHWDRVLASPSLRKQTILWGERVAGNIGSFDHAGERHVGYWIGREFYGRGIATRALAAFLRLEPVRPLFARVARHNAASIRVLEKCGFARVGEGRIQEGSSADGVEEWIYRLDAPAEAEPATRTTPSRGGTP